MADRWLWQHPDWPRFRWNLEALAGSLGQARKAQGRLLMVRDLLDPGLAKEALAAVLKAEGISTSAIEGEHLNPESVAASIARRLGIPSPARAPLSLNADGLASVLIDAVESYRAALTIDRLCAWQKALLEGGPARFHPVVIGALRPGEVVVQSGALGQEVTHFQGVPRGNLARDLDGFLAWYNAPPGSLDGLIRAGIAHLWFVTIHPFEDGNGRLTRALTDRAIAQDEDSPLCLFRMSTRILEVRSEYYAALNGAQAIGAGLDITPWLAWFLTQTERACRNCEGTLRNTLAKAKFWARHRADPINDRQRKALNNLLDSGPEGFEGGLTNRKYVAMAKVGAATAYRDIEELVGHGCLVQRPGRGRSTSYDLPWDDLFR